MSINCYAIGTGSWVRLEFPGPIRARRSLQIANSRIVQELNIKLLLLGKWDYFLQP